MGPLESGAKTFLVLLAVWLLAAFGYSVVSGNLDASAGVGLPKSRVEGAGYMAQVYGLHTGPYALVRDLDDASDQFPVFRLEQSYEDRETISWTPVELRTVGNEVVWLKFRAKHVKWQTAKPGQAPSIILEYVPTVEVELDAYGYDFWQFMLFRGPEGFRFNPEGGHGRLYYDRDNIVGATITIPDDPAWQALKTFKAR